MKDLDAVAETRREEWIWRRNHKRNAEFPVGRNVVRKSGESTIRFFIEIGGIIENNHWYCAEGDVRGVLCGCEVFLSIIIDVDVRFLLEQDVVGDGADEVVEG